MSDPLYVVACLCALVAGSEWLVRRTWLRHLGTALLVILLTAVAANVGILPTGSTAENPVPVYDGIFAYLAPLSIFWILLGVHLRSVLRAGLPLVALFVIGSLGTALGAIIGMSLVDGANSIGPGYAAVGGMFTGTYTGGSVNFNAVALHYDMVRDGTLYAGTVVADNIVTTFWMIATLGMPRLLAPLWRGMRTRNVNPNLVEGHIRTVDLGIDDDTEAVHPLELSLVIGLGCLALWVSGLLAEASGTPSVLILTVLALVLAQVPAVRAVPGARALAMFAVYLFLAVIGAYCDLGALAGLGRLGLVLLLFALTVVLIHGVVVLAAARLMRLDLDLAAVASQANVGGGTSALALARSLGRSDLVLPAILLGSLGNALGTFLGFWVAGWLGS